MNIQNQNTDNTAAGGHRSSRLPLPDTVRGITMVSMIAYHGCWDLVYLAGYRWGWYTDMRGYIWQQSICWTFIFLSGFCIPFSGHPAKRGAQVFGAGALVTAVTLLFLPEDRVIFGVLTLIGSCMLLMALWRYVRERISMPDLSPEVCALLCFVLFMISKNISSGYLGIGPFVVSLPQELYANMLTTYLGFPTGDFFSTDYFPVLPWVFLYLTGYHFHLLCRKRHLLDRSVFQRGIRPFSFLGRHALLIYLLHQPVLYGLMLLLFMSR